MKKILRLFIKEHLENLTTQNYVYKDEDDGKLMVKKMVPFKVQSSRFKVDDDVDIELLPDGTLEIDGIENWKPDFTP